MSATLRVVTMNVHKGLSQFNRRMVIHELREGLRALLGHAGRVMIQPRTFIAHAWVPCVVDDRGSMWSCQHGPRAGSLEHTPAYSGKPHRSELRP